MLAYGTTQVTKSVEVPGRTFAMQPETPAAPSKNPTLPVGLPVPGEAAVTLTV